MIEKGKGDRDADYVYTLCTHVLTHTSNEDKFPLMMGHTLCHLVDNCISGWVSTSSSFKTTVKG